MSFTKPYTTLTGSLSEAKASALMRRLRSRITPLSKFVSSAPASTVSTKLPSFVLMSRKRMDSIAANFNSHVHSYLFIHLLFLIKKWSFKKKGQGNTLSP